MDQNSSKSVAQELKEEAEALFESGLKIAAIYNKVSIGLFLYKKNPEDKFKAAYTCQKCSHVFKGELDLKMPYTINCEACKELIWKLEKAKGKKGRKKKTE